MPSRTSLFIDKLSLTFHIEQDHKTTVVSNLEHEANIGEIERVTHWVSGLLKIYRRAYRMSVGQNQYVTIQTEPHARSTGATREDQTGRRRFMRIEWNPAKTEANGSVFSLLNVCIPNFTYDWFFETANITRIDLSFDVRGAHIDSIDVITTLRKMHTVRRITPQGRLHAMEFGKPGGDRYLLVYDKQLERARYQQPSISTSGRPYISRTRDITRFELTLCDVGRFVNLANIRNPFESYSVRSASTPRLDIPGHYRSWFGDSVLRRGMVGALSRIEDRRERARYVTAFRELNPPAWWQPEHLWAGLPNAIQAVFD